MELLKSLSASLDPFYYLAYLVLALFRLDSIIVFVLILLCSVVFELTLHLPESHFFLICSIASSYVTMYYHERNNRVYIGLAVMTAYLFVMSCEVIINAVFGEWFYKSLHDSYEVSISIIHIFIIALFITWRRCFSDVVNFINSTRSGQNGVNSLFSVL